MLKACWECIAGVRVQNDEHNIPLNGRSQRAPLWPVSHLENETMFILPRQLSDGDKITVAGSMKKSPQTLSVSLVTGSISPDYQNIACQLEVTFKSHPNPNGMVLKIGQDTIVPTNNLADEFFPDESFKFQFDIKKGTNELWHTLDIYVGESYFETVQLQHNIDDIRFLSLSGDIAKVERLDFYFANLTNSVY